MGGVATGSAWASFLFGDTRPTGRQLELDFLLFFWMFFGCFWVKSNGFGAQRPTERLPIMMPLTANDTVKVTEADEVVYSEGLFTSYRSPVFKALNMLKRRRLTAGVLSFRPRPGLHELRASLLVALEAVW